MWRDVPRARGAREQPALAAWVVEQYAEGRSLRELSELTGRSHGRVRNILEAQGLRRRGAGAASVDSPGR